VPLTAFSELVARANADIFGGLGDPDGRLVPANGGAETVGPVQVIEPRAGEVLRDGSFGRSKPQVHAPATTFAQVRKDDVFLARDRLGVVKRWRVAGSPLRPGLGAVWVLDVDDLGEA
jgi:hypothetical protein